MTLSKLLFREIWFRKTHFLLSLIAVVMAVTFFVAGPTLVDGYRRETDAQLAVLEDETRKIMKKMGFNLRIVHAETDMVDFFGSQFSAKTFPEGHVDTLANGPRARELTLATHLVATLKEKVAWEGRQVLLVGYLPETTQSHRRRRAPMGYNVKRGTVYLGYLIGRAHRVGDTIEIRDQSFTVERILPEDGTAEDITIVMRLEDAQRALEKPGQINEILALGCRCAGERLPKLREQLESILPDTQVTEYRSIALARAEQREKVASERGEVRGRVDALAAVVTPLVVIVCAVWLGLLMLANVRERKIEIGTLRALGLGSRQVALLFMGKAVMLGLLGACLGFVAGTALARWLGVEAMKVSSEYFSPALDVFLWALVGAPLLSAMASYLPTLKAVFQDPAVVLREE